MTSRERILLTLRHQQPDRVPLDGWFRPEIEQKLAEKLGTEWRAVLGLDWEGGCECRVEWPEWSRRTDLAVKRGDWPGAGGAYLWHDGNTLEDLWGVIQRIGSTGKYLQWVSGPLANVDPESSEAFEAIERLIPPYRLEEPASILERVREKQAAGKVAIGGVALPFKTAWYQRGMANLLCDFLIHADFAHAAMDRIFGWETERARRMAAAGVEIITVVGDIATQDRLLFSHDVFNEYLKPRLKKLVTTARAASPLPHLYFFYHCDGNLTELLPDFIEELEFDIINPIQPECMDCYAIKQRYGNRVTLHGTMSVVDLLPNGPIERIRQTVRERVDRLACNGGFVLSSSNVIGYDTPIEHVLAMYEEARNYTSDRWG
ncbi:MAG: hypothetical protein HY706_00405 [Candidatus Hydrogenedentes bacterium]|nr:hypothetical protein [Candidatus Hydrogenedentota bacterium]